MSVAPADTLYFMSNEVPGASAVLTDDFRRGYWAQQNGDHTTWQSVIPGWRMDLSAGDPQGGTPFVPAGAALDLNAIGKRPLFATSNWAASSGVVPRGGLYPNSRNMAAHNLSGANAGGYNELYLRFYTFFVPEDYYGAGNPAADYEYGGQKFITINRWNDDGGIYWGGVGIDSGPSGVPGPDGRLFMVNNHALSPIGGEKWLQNQGNDITLVAGHWYYIESRFKLNTDGNLDGIWELWANDGGATGNFSAQTPTLRALYTNVGWGFTSSELALMGNFWFENWSNPVSTGEQFWANIYAATTGPIGLVP